MISNICAGSDIDTLAVAPRHIKREDFFEFFPDILRRMAGPGAVGTLTAVPDSFVPIIKLVLNGIEIDLIFVSIQNKVVVPKDLSLNDNKLLDGLDQPGIRALTGPRVTDEILALVPEPKTFRTALRAIKLWAQRRAIYANIVGFPGGVAWAMLVARVCQLYPHAVGANIVRKFYWVMKNWNWPEPVMLKDIETGKEKTWNPKIYPGDKKNLMPIITPAYPSMCATYNISKSGKTVILRELKRAGDITDAIFDKKSSTDWSHLFRKHTFFTADHKYYLSVIAAAPTEDAAKAWSGLVESKVRHLVSHLELLADTINLARPFTKGFKRAHEVHNPQEKEEVVSGIMKYQVEATKIVETTDPELVTTNGEGAAIPEPKSVDATLPPNEKQKMYTITFYIGIDLTEKATKNLNISAATRSFTSMCEEWANFDREVHTLKVIPCRNYDLPDDIFDREAGEVKPVKPVKAKKALAKKSSEEVEETTTNGDVKPPHADTPPAKTNFAEVEDTATNGDAKPLRDTSPTKRSFAEVEDAATNDLPKRRKVGGTPPEDQSPVLEEAPRQELNAVPSTTPLDQLKPESPQEVSVPAEASTDTPECLPVEIPNSI